MATINGIAGYFYNETLTGGAAADTINGFEGNDYLAGNDGNDYLQGGLGSDTLYGGNGNDTLDGFNGTSAGASSDTLNGGAGADVFVVRPVVEDGYNYGIGLTITDFDISQDKLDLRYTGITDIETLHSLFELNTGSGLAIKQYGDAGSVASTTLQNLAYDDFSSANVILSTSITARNLIRSGNGDLFGAMGNDTLTGSTSYYANRFFGQQGNDTLDGGLGRDYLDGGQGNDKLLGGYNEDTLVGGSGNDTLDGGEHNDTLIGGSGSDVFVIKRGDIETNTVTDFSLSEDKIDVSALGISDLATVKRLMTSGDSITLNSQSYWSVTTVLSGVNVANLTSANVVFSTSTANNTLVTAAVGDLFGGLGNDSIVGSSSANQFFGEQGNDTLNGGGGGDLLVGGDGNDSIIGGSGYDTLEGGAGDDIFAVTSTPSGSIFNGGTGIDTVSYAGMPDATPVTVNLNSTTYTEYSNRFISIENVIGSSSADRLIGNAGANKLSGGAANDTLSGGLGNDTLIGGSGNDILSGGDGVDTASFEGAASRVTAVLTSTSAGTASGGAGTDSLIYIENLSGGNGGDALTGNANANTLSGGAGNDTLAGGSGNDLLVGDAGKDSLTGGLGNDTFDFNALAETGITSTTWDVITDFVRGQDKINLSTLDANTATTTNDAFAAVISSTSAFTTAGQLKVSGGVLYGNTDADSTAEFAIQLTGISSLATSDFVL